MGFGVLEMTGHSVRNFCGHSSRIWSREFVFHTPSTIWGFCGRLLHHKMVSISSVWSPSSETQAFIFDFQFVQNMSKSKIVVCLSVLYCRREKIPLNRSVCLVNPDFLPIQPGDRRVGRGRSHGKTTGCRLTPLLGTHELASSCVLDALCLELMGLMHVSDSLPRGRESVKSG